MPLSAAWAKNVARRVLWSALEKDINRAQRTEMSAHFGGCCAYCGVELGVKWHADHLVSGGTNHISNRVPSCAKCNEHEKREREWVEFLTEKCGGDASQLLHRQSRILSWRERRGADFKPVTDEQRRIWTEECQRVAIAIDNGYQRLRATHRK
jgi:hypothetical protein